MVDVGLTQVIVKQLNRWQRKHVKPHGAVDHFHRGTRMSYTAISRVVPCIFSVLLLAFACILYFGPDFLTDRPRIEVLILKTGWLGIVAIALLTPLQVFREYVVITEDGLIKSNLFGRQSRIAWTDISTFRIASDTNKVTFETSSKTKFTMSLAYDGWQDFIATASRRMNQILFLQFQLMFPSTDTKQHVLPSAKRPLRPKTFPFGRS